MFYSEWVSQFKTVDDSVMTARTICMVGSKSGVASQFKTVDDSVMTARTICMVGSKSGVATQIQTRNPVPSLLTVIDTLYS